MSDCSLRSRRSRFEAAAFLSHSQNVCSFVRQDSGARCWARWIRGCRRRSASKNASPLSSSARRRAIPDARSSKITATSQLQRALNTVRWAMSSELTPEISITFRKTRAKLAEISLRRVMHPLLFRTASTV
jgi:hypothetical protein